MSKGSKIKSRDHGTHISVGLRVSLLEQRDEAKENAKREKHLAARLRSSLADLLYANSELDDGKRSSLARELMDANMRPTLLRH